MTLYAYGPERNLLFETTSLKEMVEKTGITMGTISTQSRLVRPKYIKNRYLFSRKKYDVFPETLITPGKRGKNVGAKGKPVVQLDLDGKFIRKFSSIKEASETLHICRDSISRVCCGRNITAGGYLFMFTKDWRAWHGERRKRTRREIH